MQSKNNDRNLDFLYQLILSIETREECEAFFDDLCTSTELATLSQRAVVAKMLRQNKVYSEIVSQTGASTATVSRVKRSLSNGKNGYEMLFQKQDWN